MRISMLLLLAVVFNCARSQQLVMPGDHPDPSVVKIGDTYWASATTSNWFPAYPLLKSKDLINWSSVGYALKQMPEWADYYFWAPEISYENGKTYIYYSAHKKNGNLCLGVASADRPEGPYRDHGPLMCQEVGSIDAFPMRDENGKLYLIWKEDGNSVGKPTPIWAMQMNEERTALIGEKRELFRNDKQWEGNLVEGVSMIRKGNYFYAFYAAAACCGRACSYGIGIARAKSLLGPWEKHEKNPVLLEDKRWKCPGHGTPVEKDGKYYFLYHAYDSGTHVFSGRQGLLVEFGFTQDGWVQFLNTPQPAPSVPVPAINDEFNGHNLSNLWQWSVFQPVNYELKGGCLLFSSVSNATATFMGQKTYSGNFTSTTVINTRNLQTSAGIAVIGDEQNIVSAMFSGDTLSAVILKAGKQTVAAQVLVGTGKLLHLKMDVRNNSSISFSFSTNGKNFMPLNTKPIDGDYLPPWDRAVRAGLIVQGPSGKKGMFEKFEMISR